MQRKGIILAGGSGSRLHPITKAVCKQLLPIYDKPMIYYPLCTLMNAGIREILIITTPKDLKSFTELLGNGASFGISLTYKIQPEPEGIAQAFLIGSEFLGDSSVALILGDNLFHGNDQLTQKVASNVSKGAHLFAYPVIDPERYGVVNFSKDGKVLGITEKPINPKSRYAVTGLYFYDDSVIDRAKSIVPSNRGELEITDLNNQYLREGLLNVELMGKGMAWLDTGTCDSLHEASAYIKTIENRQGYKVGLPEEIAWRKGWIRDEELITLAEPLIKSGYGEYLINLLETEEKNFSQQYES